MKNYGEASFVKKSVGERKDRIQDIILNQLIVKVKKVYMEDEKKTTNFEPSDDEVSVIRVFMDSNLSEGKSLVSFMKKD